MNRGTWLLHANSLSQPPEPPPAPPPPPNTDLHQPMTIKVSQEQPFVNWNMKLSDCFRFPSLNEDNKAWFCAGAWSATTFWFASAKTNGVIDWPWCAALWPLTFPLIGIFGLVCLVVVVAIVNSTVDWIKSCLRKD